MKKMDSLTHYIPKIYTLINIRVIVWKLWHSQKKISGLSHNPLLQYSVGRYGPVMTDSSRLQQHHTTSDDPGQGCKAHEGGIRP